MVPAGLARPKGAASMTIRLINAKPSPYGRKAAIALIEKNIP